jgi:hypothetical protein
MTISRVIFAAPGEVPCCIETKNPSLFVEPVRADASPGAARAVSIEQRILDFGGPPASAGGLPMMLPPNQAPRRRRRRRKDQETVMSLHNEDIFIPESEAEDSEPETDAEADAETDAADVVGALPAHVVLTQRCAAELRTYLNDAKLAHFRLSLPQLRAL